MAVHGWATIPVETGRLLYSGLDFGRAEAHGVSSAQARVAELDVGIKGPSPIPAPGRGLRQLQTGIAAAGELDVPGCSRDGVALHCCQRPKAQVGVADQLPDFAWMLVRPRDERFKRR